MVNGVRKGAWSEEEDSLLRKCIQKYGEGKWHKVPLRAGLNRCRKSCRLRWVNYLQPNIKRGNFSLDEVDLILKLHKLLGNRWSLIAGRLPGRTANDVKNFWNTHNKTKKRISKQESDFSIPKPKEATIIPEIKVIKPRPRTFTRLDAFKRSVTPNNKQDDLIQRIPSIEKSAMELLEGLCRNDGEEAGGSWPSGDNKEEEDMNRFWLEEMPTFFYEGNNNTGVKDKESTSIWDNHIINEPIIDMDIWCLLGYSQDQVLLK